MAEWKKVIVSGSDAELNHLKISEGKTVGVDKSPIQFDTISGSTSVTPIVIDADGNLFTGSEYAKASGGNTVGGSGLSQSVAIVGLNEGDPLAPGSQIQTASSAIPFNLNSADIQNAGNIISAGSASFASVSSSTGYTIHTSSLATISGDNLTIGSHTSNLVLTGSNITLEASGGITASVIPEVVKPPFFLTVNSSGHIEKVDENNVQGSGGGSGVTGITTCSLNSNINIDVTQAEGSESEQELDLTNTGTGNGKAYIANGGQIIYLHGATFLNASGVHQAPSSSLIRLKGYNTAGGAGFVTVDVRSLGPVPTGGNIDGDGANFGILNGIDFNENTAIQITADTAVGGAITSLNLTPPGPLVRATLFSVIQDVGTGVVEICLNEDLFLNDITQSGDLMFSGSSTHPIHGDQTTHQIFPAGYDTVDVQTLNITASNITASNIGAETFDIGGFAFSSVDSLVTSGSQVFGDDVTIDKSRFSSSIEFAGNISFKGTGAPTNGTIHANLFSGSGADLDNISISNTNITELNGSNGILISSNGTTEVGYDGSTHVTASIILSGSTLEITATGLGIANGGINTAMIKNDTITTAKLAAVNSNVGSFGDSTKIPTITVNAEGQVTGVTENTVSTGFTISDNSATDVVAGGETLVFLGGNGITTTVTDNQVEIAQDKDSLTLTGTTTLGDTDINGTLTVDGSDISLDSTGTFNIDNSNTTNGITIGTGNSGQNITIGHGTSETTIGDNLTVDGNLSVAGTSDLTGNVTIGGNLTVNGETTTLNVSNLHVEDRFIRLNVGDGAIPNMDSGIIFDSGSIDGEGLALYYDDSSNRLAVGKDVDDINIGGGNVGGGGAGGVVAGEIVTVRTLNQHDGTQLTTTKGTGATNVAFGSGEMVIDKDNDIWIYTNAVDLS